MQNKAELARSLLASGLLELAEDDLELRHFREYQTAIEQSDAGRVEHYIRRSAALRTAFAEIRARLAGEIKNGRR